MRPEPSLLSRACGLGGRNRPTAVVRVGVGVGVWKMELLWRPFALAYTCSERQLARQVLWRRGVLFLEDPARLPQTAMKKTLHFNVI